MDTDSNSDSAYKDPAVFFKWKCIFCKMYAKDGMKLEDQFLGCSVVAMFDSDNSIWMRCDNCAASFHMKCCMDFLNMREYNAHELNQKGHFTCCSF